MEKKWSVGILGCGMIAQYHAKAILEIPELCLAGAFDVNEESRRKFCEMYGTREFATAEELMDCPEIDIVCICLPSGFHFSYAKECLQRRKHVVVEKPMTFTVAQAEELVALADNMQVQVAVISQLRYTDGVTQLKGAIADGCFGRIVAANLLMKYYREPEYYRASNWKGTVKMDGGGALMNQGIHGIDLLQYLMGPVVSVQAYAKTLFHAIEVEDTLSAVVEFENGALGTIQATTSIYPGFPRRLEICGTDGTAVLREDSIEFCHFREEEKNLVCRPSHFDTGSRPDGMDHRLHKLQWMDFVQALATGRRPFVDVREGRKTVEIVEAIYRAAKTGEKVTLAR